MTARGLWCWRWWCWIEVGIRWNGSNFPWFTSFAISRRQHAYPHTHTYADTFIHEELHPHRYWVLPRRRRKAASWKSLLFSLLFIHFADLSGPSGPRPGAMVVRFFFLLLAGTACRRPWHGSTPPNEAGIIYWRENWKSFDVPTCDIISSSWSRAVVYFLFCVRGRCCNGRYKGMVDTCLAVWF